MSYFLFFLNYKSIINLLLYHFFSFQTPPLIFLICDCHSLFRMNKILQSVLVATILRSLLVIIVAVSLLFYCYSDKLEQIIEYIKERDQLSYDRGGALDVEEGGVGHGGDESNGHGGSGSDGRDGRSAHGEGNGDGEEGRGAHGGDGSDGGDSGDANGGDGSAD